MSRQKTDVEKWLEEETPHKRTALENASRYFDDLDRLTVSIMESIYARVSSFGANRRRRNIKGAAGDFQLERETAIRWGLIVSAENDQRFDIDDASAASAQYLHAIDEYFRRGVSLGAGRRTVPVANSDERLKFTIAAYNAGEGRIARAQQLAKDAGKNPENWNEVKNFLRDAGASDAKVREIQDYVKMVLQYAKEFAKKSPADQKAKLLNPLKPKKSSKDGHWITKDGHHILIKD